MSPLVLSAFLLGLFGSGHCIAMCGGVVGVFCSAAPRCPTGAGSPTRSALSQARYWVGYNAGRVLSYALLGAGFAALGTLSTVLLPLDVARFALRTVAAICMLAIGLHLAGLPSVVRALESAGAPLWRRLSPLASRFVPLRTPWHAVLLGGLWGFMPCGLLYGALALAASAPSPAVGAEVMAAFGIATLPVMLSMSALAQGLARWLARPWVKRSFGVAFLAFGCWSVAGLALQAGLGSPLGMPTAHGAHACCPSRR